MSEEIDPLPSENAEKKLQKHKRRTAQGLDYFPFKDSLGSFHKLGPEVLIVEITNSCKLTTQLIFPMLGDQSQS